MSGFRLELMLESRLGPPWSQATGAPEGAVAAEWVWVWHLVLCASQRDRTHRSCLVPSSCCQCRTWPARQVCDPL